MKREDLRKLGIEDGIVDQIMNMNGADLNESKATISTLQQANATLTQERDTLKGQLSDRDKDIEELKKTSGDNADLTKKLDELQAKYDKDTAALNEQITQQARERATDEVFAGLHFTSAFAKRTARREFDDAKLELKDGKYIGADDIIKKMRAENPDAFASDDKGKEKDGGTPDPAQQPTQQKPIFTNPTNNAGNGTPSSNPFNFNFTPVRAGSPIKKE